MVENQLKIEDYVPSSMLKALNDKGLSNEELQKDFDVEVATARQLCNSEEEVKNMLPQRMRAKFTGVMKSSQVVYKGVVLGVGKLEDENARLRNLSYSKEGAMYYKPKTKEQYPVKPDHFPWGNNIGQPIPDEPDWQQKVILLIENNKGLTLRESTLRLQNKEMAEGDNALKPMDKISFKASSDVLEKKSVNFSSYSKLGQIDETKFSGLMDKYLDEYITTIKKTVDKGTGESIAVMKLNVAELSTTPYGARVMLTDDSVEWDDEINTLTTTIEELTFTENAVGVWFIGNTYFSGPDKKNLGMNTYMTIVPDNFKAVEAPNEANDIIEEQAGDLDEPTEEQYAKDTSENIENDVEDLL